LASVALRERVLRPLQTAANLLAALREEDFSVRGRGAKAGDPLGELLLEINQLSDTLHAQRTGALEAGALLRRVMDEIDVAVLAFDSAGHAVLANRSAERLLGIPLSRLLESGGLDARKLRLAKALEGETPRVIELDLPGASGRFEVRRSTFRLGGLPQRLPVRVGQGPAVAVAADSDQLDQLLINLVRNAADAALETGGAVEVTWAVAQKQVEVCVADEGPGLASTANLFVPFFTTKPQGS